MGLQSIEKVSSNLIKKYIDKDDHLSLSTWLLNNNTSSIQLYGGQFVTSYAIKQNASKCLDVLSKNDKFFSMDNLISTFIKGYGAGKHPINWAIKNYMYPLSEKFIDLFFEYFFTSIEDFSKIKKNTYFKHLLFLFSQSEISAKKIIKFIDNGILNNCKFNESSLKEYISLIMGSSHHQFDNENDENMFNLYVHHFNYKSTFEKINSTDFEKIFFSLSELINHSIKKTSQINTTSIASYIWDKIKECRYGTYDSFLNWITSCHSEICYINGHEPKKIALQTLIPFCDKKFLPVILKATEQVNKNETIEIANDLFNTFICHGLHFRQWNGKDFIATIKTFQQYQNNDLKNILSNILPKNKSKTCSTSNGFHRSLLNHVLINIEDYNSFSDIDEFADYCLLENDPILEKDEFGNNILHHFCANLTEKPFKHWQKIFKWFLSKNLTLNDLNNNGQTPLDLLSISNHYIYSKLNKNILKKEMRKNNSSLKIISRI